jgi:hypothetical protein
VIDDRIRPVLESGAGIGSSKPFLVVIDEIDGVTRVGENVRLVRISRVPFDALIAVESRQVLSGDSLR